jgi:hypothetical protein
LRKVIYVIPVPDGMTPDEALDEIKVFGHLAEGREVSELGEGGTWATIEETVEDD